METNVKVNTAAKNGAAVKSRVNPVTVEKGMPAFVANNPVNEVSRKEPVGILNNAVNEEPLVNSAKGDNKADQAKPVLNLTETIKVLEELHRLTVQRNKLLATIDNLEAFEVELKEDFEETAGNFYQGCVLTIEDDARRKFTTKNPIIIWTVAQNINSLCVDKLKEVEARIVIAA
ncbi:MAG TPA: hypothetical protein VK668_16305 [Mucilaginibacter sp.]|nr:hypothetical protein [Mucilaginibacter sp.]